MATRHEKVSEQSLDGGNCAEQERRRHEGILRNTIRGNGKLEIRTKCVEEDRDVKRDMAEVLENGVVQVVECSDVQSQKTWR